jgi:hypothetical protein
MDGVLLMGLGLIALLLGLAGILPRRLNPRIPKPTGYLRGGEVGSYIMMTLGVILLLVGLGSVVVQVVT